MSRESAWVEILGGDWSGPLRLRVQGRSMWPTLRPGDQVTVEPATPDDLRVGDWVLLESSEKLFLHRLLGFTQEGMLLTKGDGHRMPDPPWPPETLRGRATAMSRQGKTAPISPTSAHERVRTVAHRSMARIWSLIKRAGLIALVLLSITPIITRASVDLVSFEAIAEPDQVRIRVTWETASEVNTSYFYVERSLQESGAFVRISDYIPAEGDLGGAAYEFIDTDVVLDETYYYQLIEVEDDGDQENHGPISVLLAFPPTSTPTPTPYPILPPPPPGEPTATSTPTPTSPPVTPSPTPTRRPTRTLPPTETPTATVSSGDAQSPRATSANATSRPSPTNTTTPASAAGPASTSTSTPTPTPTATRSSTSAAQATSATPSPSPTPTHRSTAPRGAESGQGRTLPWGLLLLIIILVGSSSVLLGGWLFWRTRGRQ